MNSTLTLSTLNRTTSSPAVGVAALGAGAIMLGFAGLQVALAAGAPLGEHVWGGTQERVLPTGMRAAAGGAAIALTAAAGVVTRRAGLAGRPARGLSPATWGIAGYLALNTFGNLSSTSDVERWLFGPATAIASALTAVVALRFDVGRRHDHVRNGLDGLISADGFRSARHPRSQIQVPPPPSSGRPDMEKGTDRYPSRYPDRSRPPSAADPPTRVVIRDLDGAPWRR